MRTICVQCMLKATVEGKPVPIFNEDPVTHTLRVHGDLSATAREREELERQLAIRLLTADDQ